MKQNMMDIVTDIVKSRVKSAIGEAQLKFKNTNPYRMEPIPPKERLLDYSEFTPDIEMMMRRNIGDAPVDMYKQKMEKLRSRYNA